MNWQPSITTYFMQESKQPIQNHSHCCKWRSTPNLSVLFFLFFSSSHHLRLLNEASAEVNRRTLHVSMRQCTIIGSTNVPGSLTFEDHYLTNRKRLSSTFNVRLSRHWHTLCKKVSRTWTTDSELSSNTFSTTRRWANDPQPQHDTPRVSSVVVTISCYLTYSIPSRISKSFFIVKPQ